MKTILRTVWTILFAAFTVSLTAVTGSAVNRPQNQDAPPAETLKLRGAWIWGTSCNNRASADKMLARAEMDKVTWSDWGELKRSTAVVLITMVVLTIVLFLFDVFWQKVFTSTGVLF